MKYLLGLLLFVTPVVFAQDLPPEYLKDATITVTLKDGTTHTFSANTHKVVKRGTDSGPNKAVPVSVVSESQRVKKNHLSVHVGVGFDGLRTERSPNEVRVDERRATVWGVGYSRLLDGDLRVHVNGFSNSTFTLGLGLDFDLE